MRQSRHLRQFPQRLVGRTTRVFSRPPSPPSNRALSVAFLCIILVATASSTQEMPGPLSSAHAALEENGDCDSCHGPSGEVTAQNCLSCHTAIAIRIAEKRGVHREVTDECTMCHEEHGGRDAELLPFDPGDFDHLEETGFALEGRHGEIAGDCSKCHPGRSYLTNSPDCASCHTDGHAGGLGTDCAQCHSPAQSFRNASRAFHKETLLPLEGRHVTVPCSECHWNGQTRGTPTRCYDCHWIRRQDDRNRTELGTQCEQCHRPTSWTAVVWDHATATGQDLGAAHFGVDCDSCHAGGVFDRGVTTECASCHIDDYNNTRDPDHAAAGFPIDCEVCHSPSGPSWEGARFAHSTYPLVGSHTALDCSSCHSSGVYQGLPSECVDCHIGDYNSTDDPDHAAAGFSTDCQICHDNSSPTWDGATYAHSIYPLVGSHVSLDCSSCHSSGVYQGLPSDCVDCHLDDYNGATDPNHQAAGFPTDCQICHDNSNPTWDGASFAHSSYALLGTHATLDCSACHSSGVYQGLPSDCADCHIDDYNGSTDPDHADAGFPTDCRVCHRKSDLSWDNARFAHSIYPLVGSHASLDCSSCHSSGVYQGLPSECVDCHLDDYNGTNDPNHQTAGFPTDCQICHDNSDPDWNRATFAHSTYTLLGTHATLDCSSCHSSGVYQGLPSDCVDCHLDDYNGSNNPDHQAAGFPTDCDVCHNSSDLSWNDGNFNHVWFPITSGAHNGRDCNECHRSAGTYAVFTCTTSCHPRSEAEEDHSEVSGFTYNSSNCYSCHPEGKSALGGLWMKSHG